MNNSVRFAAADHFPYRSDAPKGLRGFDLSRRYQEILLKQHGTDSVRLTRTEDGKDANGYYIVTSDDPLAQAHRVKALQELAIHAAEVSDRSEAGREVAEGLRKLAKTIQAKLFQRADHPICSKSIF